MGSENNVYNCNCLGFIWSFFLLTTKTGLALRLNEIQHSLGHVIKACAIIYYNFIFLLSRMVNVLKFQTLHSFCPPMVTSPRGYKTFYMLNSIEHEISTAHKN